MPSTLSKTMKLTMDLNWKVTFPPVLMAKDEPPRTVNFSLSIADRVTQQKVCRRMNVLLNLEFGVIFLQL